MTRSSVESNWRVGPAPIPAVAVGTVTAAGTTAGPAAMLRVLAGTVACRGRGGGGLTVDAVGRSAMVGATK